jgi:hypothetical protein
MALLDLESLGSQLRGIKLSQLDPELLDCVLELAAEHGEITIAGSTNLHFLIQIYRAECAREKKDIERLNKAENLILRLAGLHPLYHEEHRQENQSRGFAGRKALSNLMAESGMAIGRKERELFGLVGITDEKEMQKAISLLGEEKVAQRIQLAASSKLGPGLAKLVFGENPSVLSVPKDEDFEVELRAMENKKGLIDKWAGVSGEPLPIWANYAESPNVLLVHYANLYRALVLGSKNMKAADFAAGPENDMHVVKLLREIGLSIEDKGGMLSIKCPDGRDLWVSQPLEAGQSHEPDDDRVSGDERTAPAVPSAMERSKSHARTKQRASDTSVLTAIRKMGIDITRLSAELDRISDSSDPVSRSREQEKFEKSIVVFHELLKSGRLDDAIHRHMDGNQLKISKIAFLTGANGAFEMNLADSNGAMKKRLYLHLQDMEPAHIGKKVAEAEGLLSHGIMVEPGNGSAAGFALSEDAREVGSRGQVDLRMPDTYRFEKVETVSAAVFKEDLVLRPDPENALHADYYSRISAPDGRKEVLGALVAYFEMSRRALLPDRRPSNTFMLQVARIGGGKAFTFQPTDMDGIGNFIGGRDDGPDFSDFNHDFHKAAADFAIQMHEGMIRAAGLGMVNGDIPLPAQILSEIQESLAYLPPDNPDVDELRIGLLRDNDGLPIGIGFDASALIDHTIPSQGGRSRIIREDGRVLLDADRAVRTSLVAGSKSAQEEYIDGFHMGARKSLEKMPKRVAEIALMMAENPDDGRIARLRNMSGGEIAFSIYSRLPLGTKKSLFVVAEREANRQILGRVPKTLKAG